MWPTFYIPSIATAAKDCWDYLIPSGNTKRIPADGVSADPDMVFPIKPWHTYRAIGRLTWKLAEALPRGGRVSATWIPSVDVLAAMERSGCINQPQLLATPTTAETVQQWAATEDTLSSAVTFTDYPFGGTQPYYHHAIVDLFIAAGADAGTVALHWGNASGTANSPLRLMETSLITVKEYAP